MERAIIVIAGPTASGKSALALALARATSGAVINADSQQLYRELRILTARPTSEEEAAAPHRLYGILPANQPASAGKWLSLAMQAIDEAHAQGKPAIVTGGTGLYIKTLMEGIAPVPEVYAAVRAEARQRLHEIGKAAFFKELCVLDPLAEKCAESENPQRILRAYEVIKETGKSLYAWQREPVQVPYAGECFRPFVVDLPREVLYARCDARFLAMLEQGALDEVKTLMQQGLDPSLPALRATGYRELAAYIRGETSREEAVSEAQKQTRHYAKRQLTWFRHQMKDAPRIDAESVIVNGVGPALRAIMDMIQ